MLRENISGVVSKRLRDDAGVSALLGDRVYTRLPNDKIYPLALVTRTGGSALWAEPLIVDDAAIEVQVWADRQAEVNTVAERIRTALAGMQGEFYEGVSVARVQFISFSEVWDSSLQPNKPRIVMEAVLRVRTPSRVV